MGPSQLKSDIACEYDMTRDSGAVVRTAVSSGENGSMNPFVIVSLNYKWG